MSGPQLIPGIQSKNTTFFNALMIHRNLSELNCVREGSDINLLEESRSAGALQFVFPKLQSGAAARVGQAETGYTVRKKSASDRAV